MNKNTLIKISFLAIVFALACGSTALAVSAPTANAGPDLYVASGQTINLQGSGYDPQGYSLNYYWNCSGGSLSSYSTAQPAFTAPNNLSQTNYNCSLSVTNSYGLSSSDSMTVNVNYTGNNGGYYYGNMSVTKKVINLSSGNLGWQNSVNANPNDVLSFAITVQAGSQDLHNVVIKDILPANLIYSGNLLVNSSLNYSGNPFYGINVGTIPANGIEVISYQVRVAQAENFSYGTTTLSNSATAVSSEMGTQTASAQIIVNKSVVYGDATNISTGSTNNPITDSFLLPMALIMLGSWLYFSGNVYRFADWLGTKIN